MLTFRNTNIFFIVMLLALIIAGLYGHFSFPLFFLLALTYSLILFYGSYFIHSNFYLDVLCSATTQKKEIAISFDDGPAQSFTPQILEVLKNNNVQAVFFCIGNRIPGNEHLLKQLDAEGHVIGNHSYSHAFWFDLFSSQKMLAELRQMDAALQNVIGKKPLLFRPPYGVINPNLKKAILTGGYTPVGWNVRSLDTTITDPGKLLQRVSRSVKPGAIVLFHDTSRCTLSILQEFIGKVKSDGYDIVRLDKMLTLTPYA